MPNRVGVIRPAVKPLVWLDPDQCRGYLITHQGMRIKRGCESSTTHGTIDFRNDHAVLTKEYATEVGTSTSGAPISQEMPLDICRHRQ
jgi:hypothetical protein